MSQWSMLAVLVILTSSSKQQPFNANVMTGLGTVPQFYTVIQPTEDVYRMAFFQKPSIKEFDPPSPPPGYYMSPTGLYSR